MSEGKAPIGPGGHPMELHHIKELSQGGTKTLPELYKTAGLDFNFAPEKIKELMEFVKNEMIILEREV